MTDASCLAAGRVMVGIEQMLQALEAEELTDVGQRELIEAIVRLDRIGHPERRYGIVHQLGAQIEAVLPWDETALGHVARIVRTWSSGALLLKHRLSRHFHGRSYVVVTMAC